MAAASVRRKNRHWTRQETLCLINVWGEQRYQRQFEQMVHNHGVWENIYNDLVLRCPSVQDFGDWTKCKERLDYLRRKYRDSLKNNKKTGSSPTTCPNFDELDAVLGCRPMNNPGDMRMDNGGSSDEESACGPSESPQENDTSTENNAEDEASSHGTSSKTSPSPPPPAEPNPQVHRRRKGRKNPDNGGNRQGSGPSPAK
ncbi:uncharacterized protein LOC130562197 [Triplophysa rosa]|uniref:Zinc finger and SCAN domain-containing protein 29-like n=1 Tax=Triplophysa rosa TaxID=992332 RepID=A0A9W7TRD3_TRIRA|nr:uncharacterized protein LOC130562197 [Triplophysa rosa]KAI7803905.1 putative zinc finger and SCAN domain-containing protein 29-like [Triplophysa rosa]